MASIVCSTWRASLAARRRRDFELGLRVNLEATIALLEALRNTASVPRYVFASTIGVYGVPMPDVIDEDTIPVPSLSYGAHKLIGEILAADYSRRGHIDGVSLRLPGIVARPPQASGMLSAFLSDMLREVAAGNRFVCPVAKTGVSWWMSRPCRSTTCCTRPSCRRRSSRAGARGCCPCCAPRWRKS